MVSYTNLFRLSHCATTELSRLAVPSGFISVAFDKISIFSFLTTTPLFSFVLLTVASSFSIHCDFIFNRPPKKWNATPEEMVLFWRCLLLKVSPPPWRRSSSFRRWVTTTSITRQLGKNKRQRHVLGKEFPVPCLFGPLATSSLPRGHIASIGKMLSSVFGRCGVF